MKHLSPVKWSGSKRSLANEIVTYFPRKIDTYYEPFCGSCAVGYSLMNNNDITVGRYVFSDNNISIITLFNAIKYSPEILIEGYSYLWSTLYSIKNLDDKKIFFNTIRAEYNSSNDPVKFLFLLRTCYNGLIRYNSRGEFNTSFHIHRNGIKPETLAKIIEQWSITLSDNDVEFSSHNYDTIKPNENDYCFFDPPYGCVTKNTMYNGGIDLVKFENFLSGLNCKYSLTFDGIQGSMNNKTDKFEFLNHVYLGGANSSLSRLKGKNTNVKESFYYY